MTLLAKLKRKYADIRWGYSQIGFFIGLANFLLLVYNFTEAKDFISFELFVLLLSVILLVGLTMIGKVFRKTQMSVDHDLGFEQAPLNAKVYRLILEQYPQTEETKDFISYLKRIEDKKI